MLRRGCWPTSPENYAVFEWYLDSSVPRKTRFAACLDPEHNRFAGPEKGSPSNHRAQDGGGYDHDIVERACFLAEPRLPHNLEEVIQRVDVQQDLVLRDQRRHPVDGREDAHDIQHRRQYLNHVSEPGADNGEQ